MQRITQKDLQDCCDRINSLCGFELEPHGQDEDGKYRANPNVYHLDYAYGGVALGQNSAEGSGSRRVSHDGFGTKRELHRFLLGMLDGLDAGGAA
jgi:hypothetical protein